MTTIVKRIIVALNLPSQNAAFIVFAKAIFKAMSGNAYFTSFSAKITEFGTDITALDAAETGCSTKPATSTTAARDAAMEKVKSDLYYLRDGVQQIAEEDPSNAEAIILSAAMGIKKSSPHARKQNTVADGSEEGSVNLVGEGSGPHEWRISTDEKTWTILASSLTSKTTVNGLIPGTVYYFQNRQILTSDQKGEWSQIVKLRLK
jgi:hypothetical protein